MTARTTSPQDATVNKSNPPYPFRTLILLFLLAGNFLVAAIYFHVINP